MRRDPLPGGFVVGVGVVEGVGAVDGVGVGGGSSKTNVWNARTSPFVPVPRGDHDVPFH